MRAPAAVWLHSYWLRYEARHHHHEVAPSRELVGDDDDELTVGEICIAMGVVACRLKCCCHVGSVVTRVIVVLYKHCYVQGDKQEHHHHRDDT